VVPGVHACIKHLSMCLQAGALGTPCCNVACMQVNVDMPKVLAWLHRQGTSCGRHAGQHERAEQR